MGAVVPQNPPALALHLQQPLSRLEMYPEDGARQAQSWQGPRDRTSCAGLKLYEAKKWNSSEAPVPAGKPLEHCTSSALWISPGYKVQQTSCCCCFLGSVSSRLWIQRVPWVCQDQTQSWLSSPFQAFTQLEGHLPPLLAQL